MDTSETYIKQCDCPEIQDSWKPQFYDYVISRTTGNHHFIVGTIGELYLSDKVLYRLENGCDIPKNCLLFCPRQDQLQEMLYQEDTRPHWRRIWEFYQWAFLPEHSWMNTIDKFKNELLLQERESNLLQFNSMEQLWLAFVMHELHSKKWVDGKWKNDNDENGHEI